MSPIPIHCFYLFAKWVHIKLFSLVQHTFTPNTNMDHVCGRVVCKCQCDGRTGFSLSLFQTHTHTHSSHQSSKLQSRLIHQCAWSFFFFIPLLCDSENIAKHEAIKWIHIIRLVWIKWNGCGEWYVAEWIGMRRRTIFDFRVVCSQRFFWKEKKNTTQHRNRRKPKGKPKMLTFTHKYEWTSKMALGATSVYDDELGCWQIKPNPNDNRFHSDISFVGCVRVSSIGICKWDGFFCITWIQNNCSQVM